PAVVFSELFKRMQVPISMAEARAPMGAHKKVHIRKISQIDDVQQRWQAVHHRAPDESDVDTMFREFVPLQLACLAEYADLIPGTLEAVAEFRARNLKIGSTTGYTNEMMDLLQEEATKRRYTPDATVCATDVPEGRPAPWMCVQNAMQLGVYPFEACIKVDDTIPGIEEGLNAGMWTIGLAKTGNEIGLNETEINDLDPETLQTQLDGAYQRMHQSGAHYVVDGIWDVPAILDTIQTRLSQGDRP
ncbi:MAG: phosphonoacetaldehyde hydrolase, partial [Candidatus Latescibacteria bacterium]|nr:phosphonoacetaldehyde hydrolase [Candidatus Latescibacterota bacterium]